MRKDWKKEAIDEMKKERAVGNYSKSDKVQVIKRKKAKKKIKKVKD